MSPRVLVLAAVLPALASLSASASAQVPFPQPYPQALEPGPTRQVTSLDGQWRTIVDPYENGYYDYRYRPSSHGYFKDAKPSGPGELLEYDFDASPTLMVPGDWNSQRPELFLYENTVWYRRLFEARKPADGRRLFVRFGAANYGARAYLNGEALGLHVGGFTPFGYEITEHVRDGSNSLVVKVDATRKRDGIPTVNTDWWNYGGLTRSVHLVEVPSTFVSDAFLHLDDSGVKPTIRGWVQLDGSALEQKVTVTLPELGAEVEIQADVDGKAEFEMPAPKLERWTPERPRLYDVEVKTASDTWTEQMGFRTLTTRGHDILLNGEPVFLRGISIHEEAPGGGRAFSVEHARALLGWAKELGCNYVRLAHYPHNELMVREAERLGLLVWSEIPVYWTILWDNPSTYALAEQQLQEMIRRDRNRAAVAIWSVANETPRSPARLSFLTRLIDEARRLDPSRLISAATEITWQENHGVLLDDPLGEHLDVLGVNEYIGWYVGKPEDAPLKRWRSTYKKPLVISEFGAGALAGHHGDSGQIWTEEFQARLYREQLKMLRNIDFLRGTSPWILMDFRSPRRPLPGIQDFWNRKGLLSERGQRKEAFYVMQQYYRELAGDAAP